MSFKELLAQRLRDKLSQKELNLLPSGFQNIGNIIILNLKPELKKHKKEIGNVVLEIFPRINTVCNKKGVIFGKFRKPQLEVIAGFDTTETKHNESGCIYKFDVRKIMFAKGNFNEKRRIANQVKKTDIIVDMFAGIGYFTIPMGKLGKPKKIFSIELNPVAFKYLKENIKLNKLQHIVEPIKGDCKEIVSNLHKRYGKFADRVMMGYLPPPKEFLEYALRIVKPNGVIHYETLIKFRNREKDVKEKMMEIREVASKQKLKVKLLEAKKVKGFSPTEDHYTFDIEIY